MPDTETIARILLKMEKKCEVIMEQARKREAVFLQRAKEKPQREAQYKSQAAQEVKLAEELCKQMMDCAKHVRTKSADLMVKKLLGE